MKNIYPGIMTMLLILLPVPNLMAVEEAKYTLVEKEGDFEIRDYAPQVVAETRVEGSLEDASSRAFRRLFRYITGNNKPEAKIAMTAPVSQEPAGQEIAMTAPVTQSPAGENNWIVRFIMPSALSLEALPAPGNDAVQLRQLPARRVVAVRFSGRTDDALIAEQEQRLHDWMAARGLSPLGPPTYAYYNDPFTPGFLRRNEIQLPVARSALPAD